MENVRQVAELTSTPIKNSGKVKVKTPAAPRKQKIPVLGSEVCKTPVARRENPYKFVDIMGDGFSHLRESALPEIEFVNTKIDKNGSYVTNVALTSGRCYEINADSLATEDSKGVKRNHVDVSKEAFNKVRTKVNNYMNRHVVPVTQKEEKEESDGHLESN